MSCQQLYIEEKIQIMLYIAKYMHVNLIMIMSLLEGGVTQKK